MWKLVIRTPLCRLLKEQLIKVWLLGQIRARAKGAKRNLKGKTPDKVAAAMAVKSLEKRSDSKAGPQSVKNLMPSRQPKESANPGPKHLMILLSLV